MESHRSAHQHRSHSPHWLRFTLLLVLLIVSSVRVRGEEGSCPVQNETLHFQGIMLNDMFFQTPSKGQTFITLDHPKLSKTSILTPAVLRIAGTWPPRTRVEVSWNGEAVNSGDIVIIKSKNVCWVEF